MEELKSIDKLLLSLPEDWRAFNEHRKKKHKGFGTGLESVDSEVRGLTGIVGIQGAPGSCKSTLALQIASYNAAAGNPVLIVDRENGKHRFRSRLLAQVCKVSQEQIEKATDEQMRSWYQEVSKLELYVETEPVFADTVRQYLSELWDRYHRPILLVVDSLQALPRMPGLDERLGLQKWLEELDQLKLDFEGRLVVIMTSEKRRGSYAEASNDAGKGTGSIEFKCELLFDMRKGDAPGHFLLALVKNRDGACFEGVGLKQVFASKDASAFLYLLEPSYEENLNGRY